MSFIRPMLASPLPDGWKPERGKWCVEEKFDGHRLIVQVGGVPAKSLMEARGMVAWSRYGKVRDLPQHITQFLQQLPEGVYDGELTVPGKRSYGVTELVNQRELVYIVFDFLEVNFHSALGHPYEERRALLEEAIGKRCLDPNHEGDEDGIANQRGCGNVACSHHLKCARLQAVQLASSVNVESLDDIERVRESIYARDGEGLIIKRRAAVYEPGKRSKSWFKVKQLQSAVLTVMGFTQSRGKIIDRGPYAAVLLRDAAGNETTVKTLNDVELDRFEQEWPSTAGVEHHPAVGRKLRIEYQERTPDGSYRHPRWDRWEDE